MDQSRPLVCLFSPFSHYNFNYTNWKKHRWCAWDLNPWPQDGRCRRYHGAMASAPNSQYHKKPSVVDINQHSMIVIHVLVFYWLENCLHHDSWEFIRLSTGYKLFCPFDSLSRHLIFILCLEVFCFLFTHLDITSNDVDFYQSLISGLSQCQNGPPVIVYASARNGLQSEEVTWPKMLQSYGYRTAAVGECTQC